MATVGAREAESGTLTVRSRFGGEMEILSVDEFITRIEKALENKTSF